MQCDRLRTPRLGLLLLVLASSLATSGRAEEDCLSCHELEEEVEDPAYVVDPFEWEATVHGEVETDCVDCHVGAEEYPHPAFDPDDTCEECHDDAVEDLAASVHGGSGGPIEAKQPDCESCHGPIHSMAPADALDSWIHPIGLAETCGACHADPDLGAEAGITLVQPIAAYTASVHARALERGETAATCTSCHAAHDILPASDPRSTVNRKNVVGTCGECHDEISQTFRASVHGQAALRGIRESPLCTDCHGEHRILGPAETGSPVSATNLPKMTCGRCHADLRLIEKFALRTGAVEAFQDSFHGLAGRTGDARVANCASCHGVHDILPSSDPRSHVGPERLAETCGSCHPGAGRRFAIGPVHVLPQDRASAHPVVYWIRVAYLWLIGLTVGGMALHNLLDLVRKTLSPVSRPVVPRSQRRPRMARGFRITHGILLVSFACLVWTGFALTYPDAIWARPLLAWEERFGLRGWLHRVAAMVLLASFAVHAVHLLLDRRARACIAAMRPSRRDLVEMREKIRWFLGRRRDMLPSPPLGYNEKVEYLAVMWGTLVMAASGFLLWFSDWTLTHLPKWVSDAATVVHFYEAVLASLAIVVWHFYFVIFDPTVYPMDTSWLHGREAPGRTLERTVARTEPEATRPKEEEGDASSKAP